MSPPTFKCLESRDGTPLGYGPFRTWREAREFRRMFDPRGELYRIVRRPVTAWERP